MEQTAIAISLSSMASLGNMGKLMIAAIVVLGIFMLVSCLFSGQPLKKRGIRAACGVGLFAVAGIGSMFASTVDASKCEIAAKDPQILKGLRGSSIVDVRDACRAVGVEIGEVRI